MTSPDSQPVVSKRIYGVKLSTFDPDSLKFETLFLAAGFKGWSTVLENFYPHVENLGNADNFYWHVLFEVGDEKSGGRGRLWSVVESYAIERIINKTG